MTTLAEIKKGVERIEEIDALPKEERRKMNYDEWYMPVEKLDLMEELSTKGIKFLLGKVEEFIKLFPNIDPFDLTPEDKTIWEKLESELQIIHRRQGVG